MCSSIFVCVCWIFDFSVVLREAAQPYMQVELRKCSVQIHVFLFISLLPSVVHSEPLLPSYCHICLSALAFSAGHSCFLVSGCLMRLIVLWVFKDVMTAHSLDLLGLVLDLLLVAP